MMAKEKIRIRLKAYDHRILDQSAEKNSGYCKTFRSKSVWSDSTAD